MDKTLVPVTPQQDALAASHAATALDVVTMPDNLMAQIMKAADNGTPVAQLEKLMDLYERVEKRTAEKEFFRALAEFQAACPAIVKTRHSKKATDSGTGFDFLFANLPDVVRIVGPELTQRGFSFTFHQALAGNTMLEVFCTLRHKDGHYIVGSCPVPLGSSTKLGPQQNMGVALAYAKRYALVSILGLALDEEAEAGAAAPSPRITDEQAATLQALVDEVKPNLPKLKKHFGVESLSELRLAQYGEAVRILEALRKGAAK